jgi:predicted nucleotidyltransferase
MLSRAASVPREADLAVARRIANSLVPLGDGRARLVSLIGSRATGRAMADSDFDLVMVVERRRGMPAWGGAAALAEGTRLKKALGDAFGNVDVSVRSGEQFAEARNVFGGVEWLIGHEGLELYSRPFEHPPTAAVSPDAVRHALVRAWVEAAARSTAEGVRLTGTSSSLSSASGTRTTAALTKADGALRVTVRRAPIRDSEYYCRRGIQQAIAVLCVFHQLASAKHDNLDRVVARLQKVSRAHGDAAAHALRFGIGARACVAMLELALTVVPESERHEAAIRQITLSVPGWRKSALSFYDAPRLGHLSTKS